MTTAITETYRAIHVAPSGDLELTEQPLLDPPAGHVRLCVEARGICHTDGDPFGGVKQSGLGREGGSEGIEEYLETTYVATTW